MKTAQYLVLKKKFIKLKGGKKSTLWTTFHCLYAHGCRLLRPQFIYNGTIFSYIAYIYIHLFALLDMGTINGMNIWRERRTVIVNWEKILSQGGSRCWQERWQKRSGVYYDRHMGCTQVSTGGTQVSTSYTVIIFFFSFLR